MKLRERTTATLLIAILMISTLAVAIPAYSAPEDVVEVTHLGDDGWFSGDTRPEGIIDFVVGPATPPMGVGSLKLQTFVDNADKATLEKLNLEGFGSLSEILANYDWYKKSEGAAAPALKLGIDTTDPNPDDSTSIERGENNFDKILVYEPYANPYPTGGLPVDTWTTETISQTTGNWWIVDLDGEKAEGYGNYVPLLTLEGWLGDDAYGGILSHPDTKVVSIQLGIGSGNPDLDSYVDNFYISLLDYTTDFEPPKSDLVPGKGNGIDDAPGLDKAPPNDNFGGRNRQGHGSKE